MPMVTFSFLAEATIAIRTDDLVDNSPSDFVDDWGSPCQAIMSGHIERMNGAQFRRVPGRPVRHRLASIRLAAELITHQAYTLAGTVTPYAAGSAYFQTSIKSSSFSQFGVNHSRARSSLLSLRPNEIVPRKMRASFMFDGPTHHKGSKHLAFVRVSQLHFSSTHSVQVHSAVYRIEATCASISIVDCFFRRSSSYLRQRCRCAAGFIGINR